MSNKLKRIDFVRENCDVISVDINNIDSLNICDITQDISLIDKNTAEKWYKAKYIKCALNVEANTDHYELNIEDESCKRKVFELLSYMDITQVYLIYEDLHEVCILVPWENYPNDLTTNILQRVDFNNEKLYITIGRNKRQFAIR